MRDLVDELLHAKVRTRLFGAGELPRLGRLVLEERLGGGATGAVFAAYDPRLERRVAVKVLHEADARVLAEARALAKLTHPNVVAVYDADEVDGIAFIVMELVTGSSLRAWIAEPRPWRDVLRVMREAADGLAAAHGAGLVHRDLKPDNILVGNRARVGDFGPDAATPAYSAPEGNVDARSDQYSFGVTFHEALHGTRPPVASRRVPAWLARVLARATDPRPDNRFPSMTALRVALDRPRRALFIGAGAAILASGAVLGALAFHHGDDGCTGDAKLHEVWNPDVRDAVRAGLTGAPWSQETLYSLDDVAAHWNVSYHEVCTTTRSDALLAARMRCLDRARARLGALSTALAGKLGAPERIAAPSAVAELPRSEDCETLAVSDAPESPAVDEALARAWAAYALGHYKDARAQVTAVKPAHPRAQATALVLGSAIDSRVGEPTQARKELDDALVAAANANAPDLEYDVWLRRLRTELFAGDPAKIFEWESFARAAAARAGRQGAELDGIFGEALRDAGQYASAKEVLERALASIDPLRPEQRAVIEMNLGSTQLALGDADQALKTLQQARDRVLSARGDRHPDLALYDDKLAAALRARGQLRDAMKLHARSLELREAAFGHDDRSIATSLYQRALTETEGGDIAKAFDDLQHAIAIRTKIFGAASPRLGELYLALSETVAAARDVPSWVEGDAAALRANAVRLDPRLDRTEAPHDPDVRALGNEPTRTALRVYIKLARGGNVQAARAAISIYQALPELERGAYDEMWAITRR